MPHDATLDDGDSALLSELLALIDDGDDRGDQAKEEGTAAITTRPRKATEPTGRKRELAQLQLEAQQLTAQLALLRNVHGESTAKETALRERRKRQRAEAECLELRDAVLRHKVFLRGLRSVVSVTERLAVGLDLCRYVHRPLRLSHNRHDRWRHFDARAHDARLEAAVDMLCRETAALSLHDNNAPIVHCELNYDNRDHRSTTYTTLYTIETTDDIAAVVRAACVAIRDVITICPSGHALDVAHDVVDADAPADGNVLYRVLRVRHACATTGEAIEVASRIATSYKLTNDYGVVLWDFVDDDARDPATDAINVTRETTGACLVRRERCDDGAVRVVFRSLGTKTFRFHSDESVEKHRRISCIVQADAMVRGDERLFRELLLDQIAAEQALVDANEAHV